MLLQNTVDPWSRLQREPERVVTLMGNRGVIHDRHRQIKRRTWVGQRWICCATSFKGIDRRPLFKTDPFSYSELFFLDEATAYAAGHRPCGDCRPAALTAFKQRWAQAFGAPPTGRPLTVGEIDAQLHRERLQADGRKATHVARLDTLPPGTVVVVDGQACLVQPQGLMRWTAAGYQPLSQGPSTAAGPAPDVLVEVLTPPSVVQLLRLGLPVEVHRSAGAAPAAFAPQARPVPAPEFETARLRVRRWVDADLDALLAVYGDADAMRWVGDGQPLSREDGLRWLDVTRRNYALRGYGMFTIEGVESSGVLGFCGIVHPGGQAEPEVKYALHRACWGRGLATEAVTGLLAYAARAHGLRELIATVAPANHASQRVLLKAGMHRGELRPNPDGSFTQMWGWRAA